MEGTWGGGVEGNPEGKAKSWARKVKLLKKETGHKPQTAL